jgi:hypothetical protein
MPGPALKRWRQWLAKRGNGAESEHNVCRLSAHGDGGDDPGVLGLSLLAFSHRWTFYPSPETLNRIEALSHLQP